MEGDVAAYLIGATARGALTPPSLSGVADVLEAYFVRGVGYATRYRDFLEMIGGKLIESGLANRDALEKTISAKLNSFGRLYIANFLRDRRRFSVGLFLAVTSC